jgi:hypothetical protein
LYLRYEKGDALKYLLFLCACAALLCCNCSPNKGSQIYSNIDFAPIEAGNEWVFQKSAQVCGFYVRGDCPQGIRKIIKILKTAHQGDTTYFSARIRDSGWIGMPDSICDLYSTVQGIKTRDSVVTAKMNDSLPVMTRGGENIYNLKEYFPCPVRDVIVGGNGNGGMIESPGVWQGKVYTVDVYDNRNNWEYPSYDLLIMVQDIGIVYRNTIVPSGGSEHGSCSVDTLQLISFNGLPAPNLK